ncbi:MAG: hypothetical protein ACI8TX_000458 [Hyphomicrobiaceae bacterium]|jgi:hypothetical protein
MSTSLAPTPSNSRDKDFAELLERIATPANNALADKAYFREIAADAAERGCLPALVMWALCAKISARTTETQS